MGFEMFFKQTITLFNRYFDKTLDKEVWFPTVFENVGLNLTKGANISESGLKDVATAKVYINYDSLTKEYMDSIEWQKLSAEDKEKYFTFDSANDFIVKGKIEIAELPESNFFEYMKKNYSNVYKVSYVDSYNVVLPHFVIGGV